EITTSFNQYGDLIVDWPHKAESKSYFPPKGYAFLLFQEERGVQKLIETCVPDDDKLYITVSSPTIKNKAVQIRPWRLADADFVLDASMPLDPRKTVFVGGVPRPLKAYELAMIMDRLYGGVCYAGIDTDPELKYPKGAGRVAFSNQQSYIAAISARFVQLQHGDIDKRVEVKPYVLDDQMCDECHGQRCGGKFAPFFCANVTCLQEERGVQKLIETCVPDDDKLYITVSSPTIKNKAVQIRPWRLADADFVLDASMPLDPRKTVFVGGVPRPLKAYELAMIMDRLYGGVCYAGIDTDPELKYPKGAGRVAFSNQQSYIAAISARFVQLQHGDIDKRVEVKPYVLDDQMCDECHGQRCGGKFAPFFCANVTCLQYYCEQCWGLIHSREGREYHKPLVKEGADRPRAPRSISTATARTPAAARASGGAGGSAAGTLGCAAPTDSLPSLSTGTSATTLSAGLYYGGSGTNAGFAGSASYVPPPPSFPWAASTAGAGTGSGAVGFAGGLSSRTARHHHHHHQHQQQHHQQQQQQLSTRPLSLSASASTPASTLSHVATHGGGGTGGSYHHHLQSRFGAAASGSGGGGGVGS
uniref:RRM domain-containing protein n=1 Tax=Anopheles quadriannulatus TaxID=34691 RepID=A0A182XLY1_ANOQN